MSLTRTNEGAIQYDHTANHHLEFFSKAGSLRTRTKDKNGKRSSVPFYPNSTTALDLFKAAWYTDQKELCVKLLLWLRDARGGSGNRSGSRDCLKWVAETNPEWIDANIEQFPEIGRWDDLRVLFGTKCEKSAVRIWSDAIIDQNGLACKWADRTDIQLYVELRNRKKIYNVGQFRRLLAEGRRNVVERKMCANQWGEITYPHVPSVAMARYTSAFKKHDSERFQEFKQLVKKGEIKINADVLFPYDCVRTLKNGDKDIADLQFEALPNYMEGANARIMTIVDTSGSMSSEIGTTTAYNIATSLGLYCSDRLPKDNPFYRKFLQFESETTFTDWLGLKFSECYAQHEGIIRRGIFTGACGATNINKALDFLLNSAQLFKMGNEQIPNMLLIISDMQFHCNVYETDTTEINASLEKWKNAGYTIPKIVYWNMAGYSGSPATINCQNVGLISGFSPSILKAVFNCEDFSPYGIMMRALSKYNVNIPVSYNNSSNNT